MVVGLIIGLGLGVALEHIIKGSYRMALDLSGLTALGPRIDAVTAKAHPDVAAAVAASEAAAQTEVNAVVTDLTNRVSALEAATN